MGHCDEQVIVSRVLAGETEAFSALVERHQKRLFRKCFSLTRNWEAAEDCVQSAFALALQNLSQFRAAAQFSTWLVRIGINVALSHLRRRSVRVEADLAIDLDRNGMPGVTLVDPAPDPETACARAEALQAVQGAIRELAPRYREVVILREIEERSTRETAEILGLSEPAVKTRLLRARDQIRQRLARRQTALLPLPVSGSQ